MTDMVKLQRTPNTRKLVLQALAGAVCGGAGMYFGMMLLERGSDGEMNLDVVVGFGVALVYLLTGILVGLGALAPRFGAQALNVEDLDEVLEERSDMAGGALVFIAMAVLLLGLTLAPGGAGALDRTSSIVMVAGASAALAAGSWFYRDLGDEMMRAASKDANGIALWLVFLLFGGWAVLAQLELAQLFTPLLFVSGFFAIYLLSVYVAVARRGMLKPR